MGGFNSRTGKYSETVSQEGNNVISNDQLESAFQPIQRNSFDNVIDYVICDQCTLLNVTNFVVKQPSHLSDHSAIAAWLNANNSLPTNATQTSNRTDSLMSLPRQFCWESDS